MTNCGILERYGLWKLNSDRSNRRGPTCRGLLKKSARDANSSLKDLSLKEASKVFERISLNKE